MTFNPQPKNPRKKNKPAKIPPKVVAAVLKRDHYTCQYTDKQYSPEQHSLHIHHRVFKKMGRSKEEFDMLDNLASCDWEYHQNHGQLKHARILSEYDDSKINELRRRYQ